MDNKKQAFEQITRTADWNLTRGNTPDTLHWPLEIKMLQEELSEIIAAPSEDNRFKELLDLKFVIDGALTKMGLSPYQIVEGYELVLASNETKSATKNAEGKITKPADFISPEPALQKILDERT